MYRNVLEWLEEALPQVPDKVIYKDVDVSITFREVYEKARAIGSGLINIYETICPNSIGNNYSKPIVVLSKRGVMTPVIFFGIVYSGHCYAPLDGTQPKFRLEQIVRSINPDIVVADEEFKELAVQICEGLSTKIIVADKLVDSDIDEENIAAVRSRCSIQDPLYIIYTSGSTGLPKGVITSHESLMCYIDAYIKIMGIDEDDIFGNQSPLDYIAAIRDIYVPIRCKASTFIIPKQYFSLPAKLFDALNEEKITSVGWSVSALTIPATMGAFEYTVPKYLKKICFSGSVMPGKILRQWQLNLPDAKYVNQYGPTEATASCTYYEVKELVEEDTVLPIGVPYDNYRVILLNEDDTQTKVGDVGQICVTGPILALGYYNAPDITAKSFVQNPLNNSFRELIYKTGDLGRYDENGILHFHGRMDRQIKYLGHRVELGEIEIAAQRVDNMKECCVIFDHDKNQIMLFYVGECTNKEIAIELRKTLPGFMVPRKITKLDEMPRLANGKTDMCKLGNLS